MEGPGVERGLVLEDSLVREAILTQRTAILRAANVSAILMLLASQSIFTAKSTDV